MTREPMIIRARVRARLLGIPLLTLDAHITAASDGAPVLAVPVSRPVLPPVPPATPARLVSADLVPGDPGSSLAHARQLVEQGARVLEQRRHQR
jgi:hypothetical protein